MSTKRLEADVVILGAGFGGSLAASALSRQGLDVLLLDCERSRTDPLQAEKIEPDQAALLRDLGLLDERVPAAPPIGVVRNFDGSGIQDFDTVEQYGMSCHETVLRLRDVAARGSRVETASVRWVRPDPVRPRVGLDDGREISARLVVVATAGHGGLPDGLSLSRVVDDSLRSLTYGFDIGGSELGLHRIQLLPRQKPRRGRLPDEPSASAIGFALTCLPSNARVIASCLRPRPPWMGR